VTVCFIAAVAAAAAAVVAAAVASPFSSRPSLILTSHSEYLHVALADDLCKTV